MFIEVLFSVTKKQPKWPSMDECLKRIHEIHISIYIDIYTHTMEYY